MTSTWRFALISLLLTVVPHTVQARTGFLPTGTRVNVRTLHPVVAASARRGMTVNGYVYRPVMGTDGRVIVPRGSRAMLEVVDVRRSGGRDRVALSLQSIRVGNRRYHLSTNDVEFRGPSGRRGTAGRIVGGTAVGGVTGGLIGGGTGAAVGAATGGTVGAVAGGSRHRYVTVPSETRIEFRLHAPARIRG